MKIKILAVLLLASVSGKVLAGFNAMTLYMAGLQSANATDVAMKRLLAASWGLLPEGKDPGLKNRLAEVFKDKFGESVDDVDLTMMPRLQNAQEVCLTNVQDQLTACESRCEVRVGELTQKINDGEGKLPIKRVEKIDKAFLEKKIHKCDNALGKLKKENNDLDNEIDLSAIKQQTVILVENALSTFENCHTQRNEVRKQLKMEPMELEVNVKEMLEDVQFNLDVGRG